MPALAAITAVFGRAYEAMPPHVRALPSRQQSREILRLVAKDCTQVDLAELEDDGERRLIVGLAQLARDPVKLEAFIAEAHADCLPDDFAAARLDPLQRRGWCPLEQTIRYPKRTPWQRLTELVGDLRAGTEDLDDEALATRLRDNIRALPSSYAVPDAPGFDARSHDMMPVGTAACYLLAYEQDLRELEQDRRELERGIEARDRDIRNLENYICELEGRLVYAER
jgi:hypothetical protein